jgi:hypothetical protein
LSSRFDADVWYRLNVKANLYEYVGTCTDDLLIVGPPGTLDKILEELRKSFTIKSEGEPSYHLSCDYKKERVNSEVNRVKVIDNLRPNLTKDDPLWEAPRGGEAACGTGRTRWLCGKCSKCL